MTDIKIENNRLMMKNGDFELVDGIDEVKQHIIIALNTFYTDWILDYTKGVDYAYGMRFKGETHSSLEPSEVFFFDSHLFTPDIIV